MKNSFKRLLEPQNLIAMALTAELMYLLNTGNVDTPFTAIYSGSILAFFFVDKIKNGGDNNDKKL